MNAAMVRALTPLFIAAIGGVIGVTVLVQPESGEGADAKWAAGFGLAGTALSGAAGLAQSGKTDDDDN